MSLYQDLVNAGVQIDHHQSDLYFEITKQSLAILEKYPDKKQIATKFVSQIDNKLWVDVPFAYLPFWKNKECIIFKEKKTKLTHAEHAKQAKVTTPCTAHHVNFGGGCLNCGWNCGGKPLSES